VLLLIDNYDSFVFNLARYLEELGQTVEVLRNDETTAVDLQRREPSAIVLSPGPCTPAEAGISVELIRSAGARIPILGVCLGHQCIAEAYGGRVLRARQPMHGRLSAVEHAGTGLFAGLVSPLRVTRYHSLVVDPHDPGQGLEVTAVTEDGEVMALEHREHPVWGVQFHPEALLTEGGHRLLANFLTLARGDVPPDAEREPPGLALEHDPQSESERENIESRDR
jgi:anthranilate synthase/aminodeoxychorismate synthase-like glutamine amidotransferase